jgi:arginine decarboxylase
MADWNIERARQTYSVPHWSEGYFDVAEDGRVAVRAQARTAGSGARRRRGRAERAGLKLPLLVRFSDILGHKLGALQDAFAQRHGRPRLPRCAIPRSTRSR